MAPPTPKQTRELARAKVVNELLCTERTYAQELARFVEVLVPKLESGHITKTKQDFFHGLTGLVQNLEQFLHLSRATIEDLEHTSSLELSLNRLTRVLPLYTQYATNYANARQCIAKLLENGSLFVLEDWELALRNEPKRTGMEGFLILPIQRIPRYVLLLTELGKHYSITTEAVESELVANAALEAEACALGMDSAVAEVHRIQALQLLFDLVQPNATVELERLLLNSTASIIHSSELIHPNTGKQYLYALLSPDILLVISTLKRYCKRVLKLVLVTTVLSHTVPTQFTLISKDFSILLECKSKQDLDLWIDALNAAPTVLPTSTVRKSSMLKQIISYPSSQDSGGGGECSLCASGFTLLTRKHLCGKCLCEVCASCSPQRRYVNASVMRVCECCTEEMDFARESHSPHLLRLSIHLTIQSEVDYYWSVVSDPQPQQHYGPSIQGKFLITVPLLEEGNVITINLASHHGSLVIASRVVNVCELVNHPRISHGFTDKLSMFMDEQRDLAHPVLVTYALLPAPDLFLNSIGEGIRVGSSGTPTPPPSTSSLFQLSATRRKSVDSMLRQLTPPSGKAPSPVMPPPPLLSSPTKPRKRFNLRAFKDEFESKAANSLFFTRLSEVILGWAIRNATEGSSLQAFYAQQLFRLHTQAALLAKAPNEFSLPQLVVSETLYVNKLEALVERYNRRSIRPVSSSSSSSISVAPSPPSYSSLSKVKQALASTFAQPVSEEDAFQFPQVANCLNAVRQMITIHRSFLGEVTGPFGFEALHRLASLAKVYSTYGTHLAECYLLLLLLLQDGKPSKKVSELLPCGGAAEEDPELALKWVLMAQGILRPSPSATSPSHWGLLDLLVAPLQRINFYCEFAREMASSSLAALLTTSRFLVKSLLRRANLKLLRELDSRITPNDRDALLLVDGRRWFLRAGVLVWNSTEVVVLLFTDQLVVCKPGNSSWDVLQQVEFRGKGSTVLHPSPTVAMSAAVSDSRFAFQLNQLLLFVPRQIQPIKPALLGVASNLSGNVVGPGGFRYAAAKAPATSNLEKKDTKLKRQLKAEWVDDLKRLIFMWDKLDHSNGNNGNEDDDRDEEVCWRDDIVAWNLLHGAGQRPVSRKEYDML
ncbi:hypothetical protein BASA81_002254 [Batrachochytrium salamandrivorans]|nr:hypothetical protein BASA81_002254 [Batrachochytrium salamandrivorans]